MHQMECSITAEPIGELLLLQGELLPAGDLVPQHTLIAEVVDLPDEGVERGGVLIGLGGHISIRALPAGEEQG